MSHGPQGEGWGIMWDNCWIALASENQKGGEKECRRRGKTRGFSRDWTGRRGLGAVAGGGFCATVVGEEFRGGNYYERRQVKLD